MAKEWKKVGQGDFYKWETPGQEVEGRWRGMKDGQYGSLGTVDREDGSRITFPLHTALLDKMDQIRPGADVLIKYIGKQKNKKGQDFKAFEVFVGDDADVQAPTKKATPDDAPPERVEPGLPGPQQPEDDVPF